MLYARWWFLPQVYSLQKVLGDLSGWYILPFSKEDEVWITTWISTDETLTWKNGWLDTAKSVRPVGKLSSKIKI